MNNKTVVTMVEARERILGRIRNAVANNRQSDWQMELQQRIGQAPQLIRPKLPDDLFKHFNEKLALGGGSCERLENSSEVPEAISRFLKVNEWPLKLRVSPGLQSINWGDGVEVSYGNTRGDDLISVTPAFCAVAETGSVVLLSGEHHPTALNFLPDVHIVVVEMQHLVAHYEDVWVKLRSLGDVPRTVNFITGPSKTADVEQTLQIGAHGPRSLHVLMVGE